MTFDSVSNVPGEHERSGNIPFEHGRSNSLLSSDVTTEEDGSVQNLVDYDLWR